MIRDRLAPDESLTCYDRQTANERRVRPAPIAPPAAFAQHAQIENGGCAIEENLKLEVSYGAEAPR